jgi:hypothetical protein
MRRIPLVVLALVLLSSCGLVGGKSKAEQGEDFCAGISTADEAGVLKSLNGTETDEDLRAYEATMGVVDDLGGNAPPKIEAQVKDFVTAYDELVTELKAATFDPTQIDDMTLGDINARIDTALTGMTELLESQCGLDRTP